MLKIKEIYIYICMINIEKYIIKQIWKLAVVDRVRKKGVFINDFKFEYNNGFMMFVYLLYVRYVCEFLDFMWSLN